jgi:hypothetical protein
MRTPLRGLLLLLALAGLACAGPGSGGVYYATGKNAVTKDGLHRIQWQPFPASYVKPGATLGGYDKLLVKEVVVAYARPPKRSATQSSIQPNYALPDAALASLKRYFHEAFTTALARSASLSLVSEPGPQVLVIAGHLVNLRVGVPPQQAQDPDESDYTTSAGEMTLLLDARDAQSGETLLRVAQTTEIQLSDAGWYQSGPVTNSGAVQQIFRTWAADFRRELEQLRALPQFPPVAAPAAAD